MVWWVGVVEDRNDPLQIGRCKVRIFGYHQENADILPTADLPWARAILPLNNTTPKPPKEGDYVCGFFLDGDVCQEPIMWGVIPGIPPANSGR
jgi:hypothetical protein